MNDQYTNREKMEQEIQSFSEQVDSLDSSELPTANIMVAGITGSGKSTLINAVFGADFAETGIGCPVTQDISEYSSENFPVRIWDTVGLELDAETTMKSIQDIKERIAQKAVSKNPFDRIHAIWYCVNSRSNRYQGAELDFISNLHTIGVPFIIVMTQCIGMEEEVDAFEHEIRKINSNIGLDDVEVVQVCAKEFKMRGVPPILAFGLDDLVKLTTGKLPEFIKSGFVAAQKVSKVQKREVCEDIIVSCVKDAKEGFFDKIPLVNIFSANNRISNMFKKIGKVYNAQIPEESIEKIADESSLDFPNIFFGLISPIDFGYNKKIMALLNSKKGEEGFSVDVGTLAKSDRVAVMIAFYGYTFIDSVEELWEKLTESQLKDIDMVCNNLIDIINRRLKEKRAGH